MTMTPNEIEVLMHFHVCTDPHPRGNESAVHSVINMFEANGFIAPAGPNHCYITTERGKAMVSVLSNTPLPKQVWVDNNDKVIKI